MGEPGAAEALLRFENYEICIGALFGEVVRSSDTGNSGSNDQHIEVIHVLGSDCSVFKSGIHKCRFSLPAGDLTDTHPMTGLFRSRLARMGVIGKAER